MIDMTELCFLGQYVYAVVYSEMLRSNNSELGLSR